MAIPSITPIPTAPNPDAADFNTLVGPWAASWTQSVNEVNAAIAGINASAYSDLRDYGIALDDTTPAQNIDDLDALDTLTGFYKFQPSTLGSNPEPGYYGVVQVYRSTAGAMTQFLWRNQSSARVWWRRATGGAWDAWEVIQEMETYGSNANGWFVRWPGGTQICICADTPGEDVTIAEGVGYKSNPVTVTLPASFVSTAGTVTMGKAVNAASRVVSARLLTTATAEVTQFAWKSISATKSSRVIAIGKWF